MVANFNNPCLSDWGVKQPSTSLNSGVWLLWLNSDSWPLVPAARHPLSRGNVTSGGELSAMGEAQVLRAEESQLWRFAPLALSTVWMQVWVVGVILLSVHEKYNSPLSDRKLIACTSVALPWFQSCFHVTHWLSDGRFWSVHSTQCLPFGKHSVQWSSQFCVRSGLGEEEKKGEVGRNLSPSLQVHYLTWKLKTGPEGVSSWFSWKMRSVCGL